MHERDVADSKYRIRLRYNRHVNPVPSWFQSQSLPVRAGDEVSGKSYGLGAGRLHCLNPKAGLSASHQKGLIL